LATKTNLTESGSTELNFLGGGTKVDGTIRSENSVRIDGSLKGKLICKNTLTVGINGVIEGEVQAKNAIIGGKIEGKVKVEEKLVLEAKSRLVGELKANKLIIDEGAVFEGTSSMGVQAEVKPPEPKPIIPKPESEQKKIE
jgi:cytoskeletal protein CcmA (bactofilin family)